MKNNSRSKPFLLFIFLLCFLTQGVYANQSTKKIQIRIMPESIVYDRTFALGEVAELDGFDIDLIRELSKLKIGSSPQPGRSLILTRGRILSRLRANYDVSKIDLKFPKRPILSRASLKVSKEELKKIVLAEITSNYEDYKEKKIQIKTRLRDIYIPRGKTSYDVNRIGKSDRIGGYSSWAVELKQDGKRVKKIIIRAKVDVFKDMLAVKKVVKRGRKIQKSDLTRIKKNISNERKLSFLDEDIVAGKVARRDLNQNEVIRPGLMERPTLVEEGKYVILTYKNKNLELSTKAQVLRDGKVGDIIPVKTISSKKIIQAIVVDSGNVQVAL